jgi:hypothetical protein
MVSVAFLVYPISQRHPPTSPLWHVTTRHGGLYSAIWPDFCLIFTPSIVTMSQKSSLVQFPKSVSQALTPDIGRIISSKLLVVLDSIRRNRIPKNSWKYCT